MGWDIRPTPFCLNLELTQLGASETANVAANCLDGIIEQLQHVLGIVRECSWILLVVLEVVGSPEQVGRPCSEPIAFTVEEVGVTA